MNISLFVVSALTVGIGAYSLQAWLTPRQPLVLGLMAMVIWFAGIYAYHVFTHEEGKEPAPGIVMGINLPEIVAAAVGLFLLASWNLAPVRATAVPFAALQNQMNVERALGDVNTSVKHEACVQLFAMSTGRSMNALAKMMDDFPLTGQKCMKEAKEAGHTGPNALARLMAKKWAFELVKERAPKAEEICPKVDALALMTPFLETSTQPILLQCATQAASVTSRLCCATTLSPNQDLARTLGEPTEFPVSVSTRTQGQLARYTFADDLNAQEKQVSDALGATSKPSKRWVAEHGCEMVTMGGDEAMEAMRGFVSFWESAECVPEGENVGLTLSKMYAWEAICEVFSVRKDKDDVDGALCEGIELVSVDSAVREAKDRVLVTALSWALGDTATFVSRSDTVFGYGVTGSKEQRAEARAKLKEYYERDGHINNAPAWLIAQYEGRAQYDEKREMRKLANRLGANRVFVEYAEKVGFADSSKMTAKSLMNRTFEASKRVNKSRDTTVMTPLSKMEKSYGKDKVLGARERAVSQGAAPGARSRRARSRGVR